MERFKPIAPTELGDAGDDGEEANAAAALAKTAVAAEAFLCASKGALSDSDGCGDPAEAVKAFFEDMAGSDSRRDILRYPIELAMDMYEPKMIKEERQWLETLPSGVARKLLVLHSLRFADFMARRFRAPGADNNDLRQIAALGLVKAAESFDPGKALRPDGSPMPFVSYAARIVWAMLSRFCNPNAGLKDTQTNARTFLLSADLCSDMDRSMDWFGQQALRGAGVDEKEAEDHLEGLMGNLATMMNSDKDNTFSPIETYNIMRIVHLAAAGKTYREIGCALGLTAAGVGQKITKLRMYLLQQTCLENPELKDLGYLFKESYWMRGAALKLGSRLASPSRGREARRIAAEINSAVEDMPYQRPLPHGSRESWRHYNLKRMRTASYIPFRRFKGKLEMRVNPPSGWFYSSEARGRYKVQSSQGVSHAC